MARLIQFTNDTVVPDRVKLLGVYGNEVEAFHGCDLAVWAFTRMPLADAAIIVDVDFATWNDGNSDGNVDDGERIQDVSGNGYHGFWGGTTSNTPVISTPNGQGIDTSGSNYGKVFLRDGLTGIPDAWDGGTTTTTPYFTLNGNASFTLEAVVNWNYTTQARNGLMGQTGGSQVWIRESDGYLNYAFGVENTLDANLFSNTIDISAAKADGQWHGIAVVYDGTAGEIRTYLDGSLLHTNTDADIGSLGTLLNGSNDFFLGAYNTTTSNYFDGLQDHYRISDTALTTDQFLVVPEPATFGLVLAFGAAAMIRRRRIG